MPKSKKRNKKAASNKLFITVFSMVVLVLGLAWFVANITKPQKPYIASGHPQWPPIMWQNNDKIIGVGPQLVAKIAQDLNLNIESKYSGLWNVVQDKVKTGDIDMLVAAYKTKEREEYMDYSIPYTIDPVALFVKKDKKFVYSKWKDLIGKKGVATVGDSYGQEFDDFLKANLYVTRLDTVQEAFDALISERADYFLYALYSGEKELAAVNLEAKIEACPTYVTSENFYITISKKSALGKFLPRINLLLNKYRKDGTIDSLIAANKKLFSQKTEP